MKEKQFENKVKRFLKEQGCYYVKFFANSYTKKGVPDILACVSGHFVGIETKADEGAPSELQIHNIKKIRASGGFAFVLYPTAFEEFKTFIINLKNDEFNRDMNIILK